MNEPRSRKDLPGTEEPSPDVLDELLRAFAADQADTGTLAAIDLTSPEVERLIGATPTPPPRRDVEPDDVDERADVDDADIDDADIDDAEVGGAGLDVSDVEEIEGGAPADDHERDEDDDALDPPVEVEPAEDDEVQPDEPEGELIRIDDLEGDVPPDEVADEGDFVVAGDPLLGGAGDREDDEGDDHRGSGGVSGGRVVSIVDSGLPDAVYVSGELDEGRSTVFIDDQDGLVGAATTISIEDATSATKIEPRLRERRIAVKRAAGRKRLRWAIGIMVVVVLIVAGLAVLGSGLFAVEDVEVVGAVNTDEAAIARVVEDLEGQPVLLVDTDAAERTLEASPWVARARVTTDFPHGATIELVERTPVVTYRAPDGKWRVLDVDGRVLAISSRRDPSFLVITGTDLADLPLGTFDQRLSAAATLVSALGDLREQTESVSISIDSSDLRLMLTNGIEVRFGQAEDLITKLVRLRARLNEPLAPRVRYIDVATAEIGTG